MAKGLGIGSILNAASVAQATGTHTVTYIDIDKIHDHHHNRQYDPRKIELLARDIEDMGLQSPIVVASDGDGAYVAVSGHRRLAAFRLLAAEGKEKYKVIPAIYRPGLSEKQIEEMLIDGNLFTEMPTSGELAAQLAYKKERLQERKAGGEKLPGKMLELLAGELGINPEAARRMDRVNRTAIPEVQEAFAAGDLSLHEAYQAAKETPEEQAKLLRERQSGEIAHMYQMKKQGVNLPPEHPSSAGEVNLPPETEPAAAGVNLPPDTNERTYRLHGMELSRKDADYAAQIAIRRALNDLRTLMEWAQQTQQPENVRQQFSTAHAAAVKAQFAAGLHNRQESE